MGGPSPRPARLDRPWGRGDDGWSGVSGMRSATLRGWLIAAVACAACIGTWAAVVSADQRVGEPVGFNRERMWLVQSGPFADITRPYRQPGAIARLSN
jgi:hypothetical protein